MGSLWDDDDYYAAADDDDDGDNDDDDDISCDTDLKENLTELKEKGSFSSLSICYAEFEIFYAEFQIPYAEFQIPEEEKRRRKEDLERLRKGIKERRRKRIIDAVKSSYDSCTLQSEKTLPNNDWVNEDHIYEAFQTKYKDVKDRTILWKDLQELYEKTNTLKRRVQTKTEKIMKTIQKSNTRDPAIKKHLDALPTIDPVVFVNHSDLFTSLLFSNLNDSTKQMYEILLFVFTGLKYNDALVNTVLLYAKSLRLVYVILKFLLGLETKSGQERMALVSWFYKVIKLILWTCGDIEKNPGPPSTKSAQGYAKIAAMRELTPILCKLINNLPVMSKAPNGFYKDTKYKPAGFKKELFDPNNSKTLAKPKELENQFYALVEYCFEKAIDIPDKYMVEIHALKSNDFACLKRCRGLRHIEEKFFQCEQIAVDHGPEGIKHLLKIITETSEFLTRKHCDETTAENRNNKRKREPKSNNERNMKRLCTDSLNQKRNETVTSSNHIDPNPIQRVPDIPNQTDDLNDTKEQTTGADSDPVVNDVSSMRSGDKLMVTSESIDIDALLKEIQKKYDGSTMTSNECFSDGQQTIEVTTSAQADNQPSTSDTNSGLGTKQACSSSKQGTNCDQNIPSDSDANMADNRISTDDLENIFPDFLEADDIFEDFLKF